MGPLSRCGTASLMGQVRTQEQHMDRSGFLRGLAVVVALGFAFPAPLMAENAPKPSSKWKMQFDHWAENDGEVVFRIAPATGEPLDVTVKVPKGTSENNVADLVAGSLKGSLGGGYKVEVEDGEKVF